MMNSIFIWEFLHAIYHLLLIMVKKGLKKTWLASYGRKYKQMSSQRNFSFESILSKKNRRLNQNRKVISSTPSTIIKDFLLQKIMKNDRTIFLGYFCLPLCHPL